MVSNDQSGQPNVENDKSGVYFFKLNEGIVKARPASVDVFIKSLRLN
jgi:hypothetical protein